MTPDLLTSAKPLAGGLPMGAVLMTQRVADVMHPGDHGSTFAASPLVAAVANVVLQTSTSPSSWPSVSQKGAYLKERLRGDQLAAHHRGAGQRADDRRGPDDPGE